MAELRCNNCSGGSLNGKCYRTKCNHVLCESCACQAFDKGTTCPLCNLKLFDGDVKELMIGIVPPPLHDAMYQSTFQSGSWPAILENSFQVMCSSMEVNLFVQNQLYQEAIRSHEENIALASRTESLHAEKIKMELHFRSEATAMERKLNKLEYCVQTREKELCDIKEAYATKAKKCEAWENAYNSLRDAPQSAESSAATWPTHFPTSDSVMGNSVRPPPPQEIRLPPPQKGMHFNIPESDEQSGRLRYTKEKTSSRTFTTGGHYSGFPNFPSPPNMDLPARERPSPPKRNITHRQISPPTHPKAGAAVYEQHQQMRAAPRQQQQLPQVSVTASSKWSQTFFNGTKDKNTRTFFDK